METLREIKNPVITSKVEESVATAIEKLFSEAQIINTHIGEIKKSPMSGIDDCAVCGHISEYGAPQGQLLVPTGSLTMSKKDKFNAINGKNVKSIMREYFPGWENDKGEEFDNIIDGINNNKKVILPFKLGAMFDVKDSKGNNRSSRLYKVKWHVSKETYKLECDVCFDTYGFKSVSKSITAYGDGYSFEGINKECRELFQMSGTGLFETLRFISDDEIILVDNINVYKQMQSGTIEVIGSWGPTGLTIEPKTKLEKYVTKISEQIDRHRKYIAPLGMVGFNDIEV